jgi:D-tyrosyl-tRNA(Tyr) deacylase
VNNPEQVGSPLISKACEAGKKSQSRAMRAVIQRVLEASVTIDAETVSRIGPGLLVLLGVEGADDPEDVDWLAGKLAKMRIFSDEEGKMNLSVAESGGEVLVVSQFTLHASTKKGNRPSFIRAAAPGHSEPLYEAFCAAMERESGRPVGRGIFGGDMKVSLVNDGPVTIVVDTKARE